MAGMALEMDERSSELISVNKGSHLKYFRYDPKKRSL